MQKMQSNDTSFDWIPDLAAFVRQRWLTVVVTSLAVMILAGGYLAIARPKFTATSTILIDTQAAASFQQHPSVADSQFANGIVESQVEVLESVGVAVVVVRKLGLTTDVAFLSNGHSLIGSIAGPIQRLFTAAVVPTAEGEETAAAELLIKMIDVKRVGMSYVLNLSVGSIDPVMSARLANAVIEAYVEAGLNGKSDNTKRASNWLEQRIGQLHDQAIGADQAVQTFKTTANIVDTDKGLMNERHLGELNSQLVLARAHTAEARSRYDQTQSILRNGLFMGDVSDALQNLVIVHLREQYVDAARQVAEWEAKLGPGHVAVTTMKAKMKDIETQIQSEVQRIANGYRNNYDMALKSQTDIEGQLGGLITDADVMNKNLVRLRALQSSADTYRTLYQNFLQRYTQAVQDQSFPISEVQLVTIARPPLRKSHPKSATILGAAAMLGLALGFGIAFFREAMENSSTSIRKTAQIAASLGIPSLGMLPILKMHRPHPAIDAPKSAGPRVIGYVPEILKQALDVPNGAFAETIRGLRVRMTRTRGAPASVRVIACVSAEPGEGKSTVCANFAFSLAQSGFRTLLLDGDFYKQSLSCLLAPARLSGFMGVASCSAEPEKAAWHHPHTRLDFLPADPGMHQVDFGSIDVRQQIARLREVYEYIVIDLPAVSADALSAAGVVDGYLLVVEWGRTPVSVVQETLADLGDGHFLGAVLNKVNFARLPRFPAAYYGPVVTGKKSRLQTAA
jgi:succinoglycan biosynthesis transport protein ExoP